MFYDVHTTKAQREKSQGQPKEKGTKLKYVEIANGRMAYDINDILKGCDPTHFFAPTTTITVGTLIEFLSDFDENLPVVISSDDGLTYGGIKEWTINEYDTDKE